METGGILEAREIVVKAYFTSEEGSETYELLELWVLNNLYDSVFRNGSGNRIVLLSPKTNPLVKIRRKKYTQPVNKPVWAVIHDY